METDLFYGKMTAWRAGSEGVFTLLSVDTLYLQIADSNNSSFPDK